MGANMIKTIQAIVNDKNIAIAGVSRDKKKWGYLLAQTLQKNGYTVFAINPNANSIDNVRCYQSASELPSEVTNVILALDPATNDSVFKSFVNCGIKRVWMQKEIKTKLGITEESRKICDQMGWELVYGYCPLMLMHPSGVHKFHRWLKGLFGGLPRELR
jgi:predicted CoA-binding protein